MSANVAWGDSISPGSGSSGTASVVKEYQVEAIGATGPGFLLLTPFVSTTPDQGSGHTLAEISVTSAGGPLTSIESHQESIATCSPCEFAVNLGSIYDFTLETTVDSEADFLNPDDSGLASAGLSFQFFEANGTTPVGAEVIPEPGTVSLIGCALLVGSSVAAEEAHMTDLVGTRYTTLAPEEVMVRAVQFFTNESWRAQSQTNRVATFVGVPKVSFVQIAIAIFLTFFFVVPGLLYYLVIIRKARRLQNLVVTTTPKDLGCDVVVTFPKTRAKIRRPFFRRASGAGSDGVGCVVSAPASPLIDAR